MSATPTPGSTRPRDERIIGAVSWLICAGVAAVCIARDLRMVRVGDVLSGASILAGFLFGTLVFVFQLRLRITDDPHVPNFGRLRTMIDRSFGRFAEAVVVAVLCTGLTVIADVTAHTDGTGTSSISQWWTAAIALVGVRLLTLMPLLVWDLWKAYSEIPG
jgi:hypothetical protein